MRFVWCKYLRKAVVTTTAGAQGRKQMLLFLSMLDNAEEQRIFTQLYETYRNLMWYVAKDILKDADLAEDAVQEAFLTLTRHIGKVQEIGSVQTKRFLVTIVKSRAIDLLRRERRTDAESYDEAIGDDRRTEDSLDAYLQAEAYEQLVQTIQRLNENYRVVLECRYLHELSEKETAQVLGIPTKTVNVRCFRAKQQLRRMLEQKGET